MIPEQTLLGFPLFGDNATKVEPDNNKKSNGWQQGDVVPAEWMNWEWYHASKGVADLNKGVTSMEKEINNVLSSFGITAAELTNNQLYTALEKIYAQACTCSTAAATAAKTVSLTGYTRKVGAVYVIEMTNGNTAANPTLTFNNIAESTAPIYNANGVPVGSGSWEDGETIKVLYTGSCYLMATQAPVDTIENDNFHPATSNAVKKYTYSKYTPNADFNETKAFIKIGDIAIFKTYAYMPAGNNASVTIDVTGMFDKTLHCQATLMSYGGTYTNLYVQNSPVNNVNPVIYSQGLSAEREICVEIIGHLKNGWQEPF